MTALNELRETVKELNFTASKFTVVVKEDYYENTGDANLSEINEYDNLEEAFNAYQTELSNIDSIDTDCSEFKNIELNAWDEDNYEMEELLSDSYELDYKEEDYGQYRVSYRLTNNGIEGILIEVINERTKFETSSEGRFSTKIVQFETKEEVIDFIWSEKLYISKDDAEEIFEMSI